MLTIFEQAVGPEGRVKLGNLLGEIGREVKLTDGEAASFERDHSPAGVASF